MHSLGSSASSATIVSPFPGSPEPDTAGLRIYTKYHMTAADLRGVRKAVSGLPRPWFAVEETLNTDTVAGHRWSSSYIPQIAGPTIADFFIRRHGLGYEVEAGDGFVMIAGLKGFLTVADAVAALWAYTAERLEEWGLVAA